MVSHNNHNLNANEGFIIYLTSKFITCFIGTFTWKMKSQSIVHLFNASQHTYWILNLEGEVHSMWDCRHTYWILNLEGEMHSMWDCQHTYWILNLEGEVHSMWDLWISDLQKCKGNGF